MSSPRSLVANKPMLVLLAALGLVFVPDASGSRGWPSIGHVQGGVAADLVDRRDESDIVGSFKRGGHPSAFPAPLRESKGDYLGETLEENNEDDDCRCNENALPEDFAARFLLAAHSGALADKRVMRFRFDAAILKPVVEKRTLVEPTVDYTAGNSPPYRDPELKRSAFGAKDLGRAQGNDQGTTIAAKGLVTGAGFRPLTIAERLLIAGETRERAERCLAESIYFEARGEPLDGQVAVAQVVLNRVFSGHYPGTVCGAVYQNAHRRNACQFSFACDGLPNAVRDALAWERAERIAKAAIDGRVRHPQVGYSTHYHAHWVKPQWIEIMHRTHAIGVHTFYIPKDWIEAEAVAVLPTEAGAEFAGLF